jgi:hypothetical protein
MLISVEQSPSWNAVNFSAGQKLMFMGPGSMKGGPSSFNVGQWLFNWHYGHNWKFLHYSNAFGFSSSKT